MTRVARHRAQARSRSYSLRGAARDNEGMTESDVIVVASFDTLTAAAAAVNALVAAGVEHGAIELKVIEDDAGPAQGNFIIGNGATVHGGPPGPVRTGDDAPYNPNFRYPKERSGQLVIVQGRDEGQRARVQDVLRQAGGRLVQQAEQAALHH
jgi:hypothetical protein